MQNKLPLRTITIREVQCFRCGFRWFPRPDKVTGKVYVPLKCANLRHCGSYNWNKEIVRKYDKR